MHVQATFTVRRKRGVRKSGAVNSIPGCAVVQHLQLRSTRAFGQNMTNSDCSTAVTAKDDAIVCRKSHFGFGVEVAVLRIRYGSKSHSCEIHERASLRNVTLFLPHGLSLVVVVRCQAAVALAPGQYSGPLQRVVRRHDNL